jgi:hypothetical protein
MIPPQRESNCRAHSPDRSAENTAKVGRLPITIASVFASLHFIFSGGLQRHAVHFYIFEARHQTSKRRLMFKCYAVSARRFAKPVVSKLLFLGILHT